MTRAAIFISMELGEVVGLRRGHDLAESQRKTGPIPIVSSSGITGFHNEAICEGPGVVTGRYGTLGQVHYVNEPYWPLNTTLYVENFKGNDPRYVAYLLGTLNLAQYNGAGAVPGINRNVLHRLPVLVPSLEVQRRIVANLSAYEHLIENNQRRIKLLEEAARRLYHEWFVALRFPGHERVKFVEGLPQGWKLQTLSENARYLNRGISPAYDDSAPGLVINQKCIRNGLLDLAPARRQAKEVAGEKRLQVGDILINSTGTGTLGRVAQVRSDVTDCTVDTHVTILRPANQNALAYWGVACLEMEPRFSEMGIGATNQQELIRAHVGAIELLVPPIELQSAFHARAWPMLLQSEMLGKQSDILQQARDALLPRLMSGTLEV